MTEDDKVKRAAEELAKEAGPNPPEKAPEGYDVSVPQNEAEVAKYTPEPDKDGEVHTDAVSDKVKVEDGHATPTEETAKRALELQAQGDEVPKEQARDAQAAAEGLKEQAKTSGADSQGETQPVPAKAVTDEEKEAKIAQYLLEWGLEKFRDKYPNELSGGQRQRTAIIEQLFSSDQLIVMD